MVDYIKNWRLRKCSDVQREYAYYEVLSGESIILELALTDDGEMEVLFEAGASGRLLLLGELERILKEGRNLLQKELASAD